jgi:hypothetical protein
VQNRVLSNILGNTYLLACRTSCSLARATPFSHECAGSPLWCLLHLCLGLGLGLCEGMGFADSERCLLTILSARPIGSKQDLVPRVYFFTNTSAECCSLCQTHTACNFFTWMPQKTGNENCWLKSSDAGKRAMHGRVSGSSGRTPPSPPPSPQPSPPSPPGVHRACAPGFNGYPFCNTSLTIAERVADLVGRIEPGEKPNLMTARHSSPLPRLGVPAYDWGELVLKPLPFKRKNFPRSRSQTNNSQSTLKNCLVLLDQLP